MRDRCDVRHHVQRRELLPNADDARFDRPRVGEVELNPVHARMRGRDRLEQRLPTTRDDHVIAAEVELLGEDTPDAARAPATRIVLSLSLTRAPPAASLGSSYSPLLLDVVG